MTLSQPLIIIISFFAHLLVFLYSHHCFFTQRLQQSFQLPKCITSTWNNFFLSFSWRPPSHSLLFYSNLDWFFFRHGAELLCWISFCHSVLLDSQIPGFNDFWFFVYFVLFSILLWKKINVNKSRQTPSCNLLHEQTPSCNLLHQYQHLSTHDQSRFSDIPIYLHRPILFWSKAWISHFVHEIFQFISLKNKDSLQVFFFPHSLFESVPK